MSNLAGIRSRLEALMRHAGGTDYAAQVIADNIALVAEVEQLRGHRESCLANLLKGYETGKAEERATVVAYMRGSNDNRVLDADAIERGEHRREEDE